MSSTHQQSFIEIERVYHNSFFRIQPQLKRDIYDSHAQFALVRRDRELCEAAARPLRRAVRRALIGRRRRRAAVLNISEYFFYLGKFP